jgi:acetoacetyl-CoA synthetase
MSEQTPVWAPDRARMENSQLADFTRWVEARTARELPMYEDLWRWSVEQPDDFWQAIWDYFEVIAEGHPEGVTNGAAMPDTEWFPGARVNYAEHVFRGREPDAMAIFGRTESGDETDLTWGELEARVASTRAGLERLGVGPGDRVAAFLPNVAEAVIAFLATASLGAVWSSCSPDFGFEAVRDRFAQIEPKVLIAATGYSYGGREFDRTEVVRELTEAMPSVEHAVILPGPVGAVPDGDRYSSWDEALGRSETAELEFTRVGFSEPLWILYSSGTTGLPKAIVQSQGGILLEHLKKMHLHLDAGPDDRIFWFTTTGWMMWNFLVSCLLTGSAIVLFDGSPGHPDMDVLWDLAADTGVTCFGTSASYISACMKAGVEPTSGRDLSRLGSVGSTGSPLAPEGFDWIYDQLGEDVWLFSTSGGTDLCTAFVGGVPTLPVYRGELQARALGASVEAWNEAGESVTDEVGELVITGPMPSMPIYLWDDDGSRYRESYFDHFPGTWRHGDWIEITGRGTAIIYGRSDSTINRGGIRMGTSEIYRAVLADPAVTDALVVDLPKEGTEGWMPLFVVLAEGAELDDELRTRLARSIRENCSPRHVPDEVIEIDSVPRTLSGKVLEVPVKRILTGTPVEQAASRDSMANPESLDFFVGFRDRV